MDQYSRRTDPERQEAGTWSRDEVSRFLSAAAGIRYQACWIVLLGTGLRCGEALGLRWSDIDFGHNIVHIAQVVHVASGKMALRTPRSARVQRTIPIAPQVTLALGEEQTRQQERRRAAGAAWHALDLALAGDDGTPVQPDALRRSLRTIARVAGTPVLDLHDLRATYACLAREAGADMATIALLMGSAGSAPAGRPDGGPQKNVPWVRQRKAAAIAGAAILGRGEQEQIARWWTSRDGA